MTVIGDSIAAGAASTDYLGSSWLGLLADQLGRRYGHAGDFWMPTASTDFTSGFRGQPPFTLSTAPHRWDGWGFGRLPLYKNPASEFVTFKSPYPTTRLQVTHFNSVGGTWAYRLDDRAPATVTSTSNLTLSVLDLDHLPEAAHTFTITTQSADYAAIVQGIATMRAATGVAVGRVVVGGIAATDFIPKSGQQPRNLFAPWSEPAELPRQPHLLVLALGINDCQGGEPAQRFGQALREFITAARQARPGTSVLLVANANLTHDMTNPFANAERWPEYVAQMKAVAHDTACALVDIGARWGESALAAGYVTPDLPDPTDRGHVDMAEAIGQAVMASGG